MSKRDERRFPQSATRRRFLEVSGRYGFTTAVLAATGGYLWSNAEVARAADDEAAKEKAAKHTMIFATEYKADAYKTYVITSYSIHYTKLYDSIRTSAMSRPSSRWTKASFCAGVRRSSEKWHTSCRNAACGSLPPSPPTTVIELGANSALSVGLAFPLPISPPGAVRKYRSSSGPATDPSGALPEKP